MKKNKVLVVDIETSPILTYVWTLREPYITPDQIVNDWYVMAWSAKWYGDKKSHVYRDTRGRKWGDDLPILKPLWELLNEADIVVSQNGKNFDAKKLNARFMIHGLKPPKPFKHADTYQIARSVAGFTSNRLEYLTAKICKKYKKISHAKFPGNKLWRECLSGNLSAWKEMKRYNLIDVLCTEELYTHIAPWAPASTPKPYDLTDTAMQCGTCGYEGQMREGRERTAKTFKYKQHSCPKCGAWQPGEKVKGPKNGRV